MARDPNSKSWWGTVPGILTAISGIITAVATLITVLNQIGMFETSATPSVTEETRPTHPAEQTTDGWTIIGKSKNGRFFDLKLMVHSGKPAIGRRYDAVEDFRLIQKRPKKGEDQGQVVTLGMVNRGDAVEVLDLYVPTPSTEKVQVWAKLRAVLRAK